MLYIHKGGSTQQRQKTCSYSGAWVQLVGVAGLLSVGLIHAKQTAHHRAAAALLPGCTATATVKLARQLLVAQTLQTGHCFTGNKLLDLTR